MNPSSSPRPARCRRTFLVLAALCLLGTFAASPAHAYVLENSKWPAGNIVMYLQLGSASGLIDGATSWDSVAESALAIWNPYLGNVQFQVATATTANVSGDRKNSVFFSSTVFGSSFGSDTLAVTRTLYTGTTSVESDVVCNSAIQFNSYRGNLRTASGGGSLIDIRRVLLHEFGHILGLDHTAQGAQSIMSPAVTNIDTVQADDIAGVAFLYGGGLPPVSAPVITSSTTANVTAGVYFSYQITATNSPLNYIVSGLPPGLTFNSSTGLISGTPVAVGTYAVSLRAVNAVGTGTATLTLTVAVAPNVAPPVITSATSAHVYVREGFSYVITATNFPTGYAASGLPPGVAFNASASSLLAGVVTVPGTYQITISASNAGGTGTATLTLVVYPVWGTHPVFFSNEQPLTDGVYYLSFANRNVFGYYTYLSDPHYIYHFDLGFEYWFDAQDGQGGMYFYDFTSGDWFYTSPTFAFPYLYDFTLRAFLYYYPNPTNPQRYNTDGVRYFYNFTTRQVIVR